MKGCYTAIITPFKNGKVDYSSLERLIEFQIAEGIDGIVPCGTTGESPTLSHDEHREVVRFTHQLVNKRVKVIAGSGSNSTKESLNLSIFSDELGVDGLLMVCPYYNKPTQEGLYQHYSLVAQEVKAEIVIYNIPGRSGVSVDNATILKLAELENITTVKEATGNIDMTSDLLQQNPNLHILSGNDSMNLPIYSVGGHGSISVLSNIFPKQVKQMYDLAKEGKWTEARELHYKFWDLGKALFTETNPIPIKAACRLKEIIDEEEIRLPLVKASKQVVERLEKILKNI